MSYTHTVTKPLGVNSPYFTQEEEKEFEFDNGYLISSLPFPFQEVFPTQRSPALQAELPHHLSHREAHK